MDLFVSFRVLRRDNLFNILVAVGDLLDILSFFGDVKPLNEPCRSYLGLDFYVSFVLDLYGLV